MNFLASRIKTAYAFSLLLFFVFGLSIQSRAHCDRVNGPVAVAAKQALEIGELSKALIWVGEEQEKELTSRFEESLKVYNKGEEARQLAIKYFMETTVRLHREAEGMPYTGLKPSQKSSEDIQMAEIALKTGDLSTVTNLLAKEISEKTKVLYQHALDAKEKREQSVEEGRQWVDAYVKYIVYVHSLYQKIQAGPDHGVGNNNTN